MLDLMCVQEICDINIQFLEQKSQLNYDISRYLFMLIKCNLTHQGSFVNRVHVISFDNYKHAIIKCHNIKLP